MRYIPKENSLHQKMKFKLVVKDNYKINFLELTPSRIKSQKELRKKIEPMKAYNLHKKNT